MRSRVPKLHLRMTPNDAAIALALTRLLDPARTVIAVVRPPLQFRSEYPLPAPKRYSPVRIIESNYGNAGPTY